MKSSTKEAVLTRPREYFIWRNMIDRCYNPNYSSYKWYGAKGIRVCQRWLKSFDNFIEDMNDRPSPKHSLDRIDGLKNYQKSNCRWATWTEQANNTSRNKFIIYNGERMTIAQAARKFNINKRTLWFRLNRSKWPMERALHESPEIYKNRSRKLLSKTIKNQKIETKK